MNSVFCSQVAVWSLSGVFLVPAMRLRRLRLDARFIWYVND
jgi:hypothetical protein